MTDTILCDHRDPDGDGSGRDAHCKLPVAYECGCNRCSREDTEDRFHACAKHLHSGVILERHRRIYPGHALAFTRTP